MERTYKIQITIYKWKLRYSFGLTIYNEKYNKQLEDVITNYEVNLRNKIIE